MVFGRLLKETNYDLAETEFIVQGFTQGFDLHYEGPEERQSRSKNIPLTVGNKVDLWNKIMKEVRLGHVAGPFDEIPYKNFIQSPIGLVPKAGEGQTHLIFHLSYNFANNKKEGGEPHEQSVNHHTPKNLCSVKYRDLDFAVRTYLQLKEDGEKTSLSMIDYKPVVYGAKTDVKGAFRLVPLLKKCWKWLVMMAENPMTKKFQYFIDKCLPFGASISCSHFQRISNALRHIMVVKHRADLTNYLDDFLFLALTILRCNYLLNQFLQVCDEIGIPMALEKTEYASDMVIFLGLLLNGKLFVLSLPIEKRNKAETLLRQMLVRTKTTVHDLQVLCGYLNFLGRAIYPGRAFTRRMYAKYSKLVDTNAANKAVSRRFVPKPHHHIKIDPEFKGDCEVWLKFITDRSLDEVVN